MSRVAKEKTALVINVIVLYLLATARDSAMWYNLADGVKTFCGKL